ncbi:hypothetical protein DAPPUDRAFT_104913 [Daphnia pulex]|uniref:Uncharacterized protein n=1 Tax=Daphnia pulex TaxID=6669 RepID=E9GNS3_DAPPU|nr:hypothetical protein DAPPUDRAFT_104913 [Daphnia pulex]|eukprot:EFX78903.1 hypothetical protein DAPPUDRAFT_104913 [Daphnia pulex]
MTCRANLFRLSAPTCPDCPRQPIPADHAVPKRLCVRTAPEAQRGLHGPGCNLRPRPWFSDSDDTARLTKHKVLTFVHAPEILKKPTYRTRTEFNVIRENATLKETRRDGGSKQAGSANEDPAKEIIRDWEEFCRTPSKKTTQEIQDSPDSPEGPLSGARVQPIKLSRRSGYTTNKEFEDLLKEQKNWELTESSPVVTVSHNRPPSRRGEVHQQEDTDQESRNLPSYLKQLRCILLHLREAAGAARRNLDQIRRLAYDGDIVKNGIHQTETLPAHGRATRRRKWFRSSTLSGDSRRGGQNATRNTATLESYQISFSEEDTKQWEDVEDDDTIPNCLSTGTGQRRPQTTLVMAAQINFQYPPVLAGERTRTWCSGCTDMKGLEDTAIGERIPNKTSRCRSLASHLNGSPAKTRMGNWPTNRRANRFPGHSRGKDPDPDAVSPSQSGLVHRRETFTSVTGCRRGNKTTVAAEDEKKISLYDPARIRKNERGSRLEHAQSRPITRGHLEPPGKARKPERKKRTTTTVTPTPDGRVISKTSETTTPGPSPPTRDRRRCSKKRRPAPAVGVRCGLHRNQPTTSHKKHLGRKKKCVLPFLPGEELETWIFENAAFWYGGATTQKLLRHQCIHHSFIQDKMLRDAE